MSPLVYSLVGLIVGGSVVALVVLLVRRGAADSGVQAEVVRRLEMIDRGLRDEFSRNREEAGASAKNQREELTKSLESVRSIVDSRLKQLQEDNSSQIDKMRATVDEKLQGTLEKRLGESFKLVSDRLEQVHQGLGAMQQLASDVGGLQRVLTNVKTRGGWSEWQLGVLLEEMLTPEQFAKNMQLPDGSAVRFTTAKYYTPSKQVIQGNGVTPNIRVAVTPEQERSLFALRNTGNMKPEDEKGIIKARDPQMLRAIDALKGVMIYAQENAPKAQAVKK